MTRLIVCTTFDSVRNRVHYAGNEPLVEADIYPDYPWFTHRCFGEFIRQGKGQIIHDQTYETFTEALGLAMSLTDEFTPHYFEGPRYRVSVAVTWDDFRDWYSDQPGHKPIKPGYEYRFAFKPETLDSYFASIDPKAALKDGYGGKFLMTARQFGQPRLTSTFADHASAVAHADKFKGRFETFVVEIDEVDEIVKGRRS